MSIFLESSNNYTYPPVKNRLVGWGQKIINAGIENTQCGNARKKIRLTNKMSISLAAVSFPFAFYFYYLGYPFLCLGVFILNSFYFSTIYLNYKTHYRLAKVMLIIIVNFGVFPYALLFGKHSGIQYMYLPFSCLGFVLFELKDWKYIVASVMTSLFLFFIDLNATILNIPFESVDLDTQSKMFFPVMLVVFSVIIINIFFMSKESELAENDIIKVKQNYELQINEAKEVLGSDYTRNDSIAQILNMQIIDLKKSGEELKESNSLLQTINNDLDNFIYTASHDLKSPIANIEGLINVLMSHDNYEKKEVKEIVDMMSVSVSKFKNTISELVEISRIEKEGHREVEEVLFEELLEDVKFSINELIKVAHARITSDFSAAPCIRFSKKNLRSIIYNLLSNAIKYKALDRAPMVHIATREERDFVVFQIEDNGLGISEENFPKIFSMFKRVHDHVEGSGVGLYIVKKIMENSKGSIAVESRVGSGSKFRLYFRKT